MNGTFLIYLAGHREVKLSVSAGGVNTIGQLRDKSGMGNSSHLTWHERNTELKAVN